MSKLIGRLLVVLAFGWGGASAIPITDTGTGGSDVAISDNGTPVTSAVQSINFVGGAITEPVTDQVTFDVIAKFTSLYDADPNIAVIILAIGDSNMTGGQDDGSLSLQTANPNVYSYTTEGSGASRQNLAGLAWRNIDPNSTMQTDYPPRGTAPYWGFIRAGSCTTSYAAADRIQKALKRPVGLITVHLGATNSTYWMSTGASNYGYDSLASYLTTAISSFPILTGYPTAPTYASVVVFSEGANDMAAAITPQGFVDNMAAIRTAYDTAGWTKKNKTLWLNLEVHQDAVDYTGNQWPGYQYLEAQTDEHVRVVRSYGLELFDEIHFTHTSHNELGIRAADIALKGLMPKTLTQQGAHL